MSEQTQTRHFLDQQITSDLESGEYTQIVTRFPPEPNGFLHIGHAKSIWLNFGLAERYKGLCNLRFDDTNPEKEDQHFIEAIKDDVKWLGFSWAGDVKFASSYFDKLYEWAVYLIEQGKAYVCDLSATEAREYRGTLTEPGRNSPYRERSIDENLHLFQAMKNGEMADGQCVLRAKIDMTHGNINMRDPILYRVRNIEHHQTGSDWCIYPTYDFAHGQEDAIEGVTHSICTLEFADHRPLYEWFIDQLPIKTKPRQYEFARLNVDYTITSKRKLKCLVDEAYVDGWDDPRMPTIAGLRRRGYTPAALRQFCEMTGVTKSNSTISVGMLEYAIRNDLDKNAARAMCVLRPLKVILTNYPEAKTESLNSPGHPVRDDFPSRTLPFSREIFIDQDDFREQANKKYKRLVIGKRVRLRNAYVIEAFDAVKDDSGNIVEVHARVIENTVGNDPEDGVKPKGVIHWVCAKNHLKCDVNLYDRLFVEENPMALGDDFLKALNPESLIKLSGCVAEIGLEKTVAGDAFQFEREGYFCRDIDTQSFTFNRTIGLRDSWAKIEKS